LLSKQDGLALESDRHKGLWGVRILLHDNCLTERGTTTSIINYSRELKALGFEVFIGYNSEHSTQSDPDVVKKVAAEFDLVPYATRSELHRFGKSLDLDFFYAQKGGNRDGIEIPGTKNLVHAVFQMLEPHGERYAFISEWLARKVSRSPKRRVRFLQRAVAQGDLRSVRQSVRLTYPYVPYIVALPQPQADIRDEMGISKEVKIIGTLCGSSEFNIPFVKSWVIETAQRSNETVFLLPNVPAFCDLPNVRFMPKIIREQQKADYLNSLNVFLHAREIGESFGMAIHEALSLGVPVMTYNGGRDKNHVELLQGTGWLYENGNDLDQLSRLLDSRSAETALLAKSLAAPYSAKNVIAKFQAVFLQ
jgi:hypothetical protein